MGFLSLWQYLQILPFARFEGVSFDNHNYPRMRTKYQAYTLACPKCALTTLLGKTLRHAHTKTATSSNLAKLLAHTIEQDAKIRALSLSFRRTLSSKTLSQALSLGHMTCITKIPIGTISTTQPSRHYRARR